MTALKIWALLDDRQGNTNQTLGVAEALGLPFETKRFDFTPLVRLPNPLIYHSTLGMTRASAASLKAPWPDVVISTARRLGLVASCIKHRNPATFLAQVQWPGYPSRHFDLIAAPLHDEAPAAANVFHTVGAPHRVTEATLKREAQLWGPTLSPWPAPRVAMLVGGSTRSREFAEKHARKLAELSSQLARALSGSLLITTSRRTGAETTERLKASLDCPHYLHAWDDDPSAPNPFYGLLAVADAVIATGDSISMCSEACATGRPVFIYAADDFMSVKHRMFVKELFARGLARPLAEAAAGLFTPPYRLDDARDVAARIKSKLKP